MVGEVEIIIDDEEERRGLNTAVKEGSFFSRYVSTRTAFSVECRIERCLSLLVFHAQLYYIRFGHFIFPSILLAPRSMKKLGTRVIGIPYPFFQSTDEDRDTFSDLKIQTV